MSKEKSVSVQVGPGAMFSLFLVFLVLKLTGMIGWSWWWVTAPLWGGLAFALAALVVMLVAGAIITGLATVVAWWTNRR